MAGNAEESELLTAAKQARERYTLVYRQTGRVDPAMLPSVAAGLQSLAAKTSGAARARALYELGTIQRVTSAWTAAATTLRQAAELAAASGAADVAFDAWIGVARTHVTGTADHGAAARALEQAVTAAGGTPTRQQHYELLLYRAELEMRRGEVESGLINALEAQRVAIEAVDRFNAERDVADGLDTLASRCNVRPLIDERSIEREDTLYGACRRAIVSAQAMYERAAATAESLGWAFMAGQMRDLKSSLDTSWMMIDLRARHTATTMTAAAFSPRSAHNVLVNRDFRGFGSMLSNDKALASLVAQAASESLARLQTTDARSVYLRGVAADVRSGGQDTVSVIALYSDAARHLAAERGAFFDPRRRGTVIENRVQILEALALGLLEAGQEAEAFTTFESARARGLGEIAAVLSQPATPVADRQWFAALIALEARASKLETLIVRQVIAYGSDNVTSDRLAELDEIRTKRGSLLRSNEAARARFMAAPTESIDLGALRAAAVRADTPVLLYWCTDTNVIVWVVSSRGDDVRTVFLPLPTLSGKVSRLVDSAANGDGTFDETMARELYLYLVAPFAPLLGSGPLMIVPQGPLTALPFEALIDPESGEPLIERFSVSYAPNATFAAQALARKPRRLDDVAVLANVRIDDITHERAGIAAAIPIRDIGRQDLASGLNANEALHILFHGEFDPYEPLLSTLKDPNDEQNPLLAADLLALPLAGRPLVVLSACESGRTEARISNEIFGFPWAVLASGAEASVLSRWRVDANSNSDWMRTFYQGLASDVAPSIAAANAMREFRATGRTHPYYWAAMQVSGR